MSKPTPKQARQIVEAFYLAANPKPMGFDHDKVTATVFYCMKEGHSVEAISQALPKCRAFTIRALDYNLRVVSENSHQPEEQRRSHPKPYVPTQNSERTIQEVETAQQNLLEMRENLRTPQEPKANSARSTPHPPVPPAPKLPERSSPRQ